MRPHPSPGRADRSAIKLANATLPPCDGHGGGSLQGNLLYLTNTFRQEGLSIIRKWLHSSVTSAHRSVPLGWEGSIPFPSE